MIHAPKDDWDETDWGREALKSAVIVHEEEEGKEESEMRDFLCFA